MKNDDKGKQIYSIVAKIKNTLKKYSISDILTSLFVVNLWLPNISSNIKQQFIIATFFSMLPEFFAQRDKIDSYSNFSKLIAKLIEITPDFSFLDDYVPDIDWGDIKYYFDKHFYKFFFGQELSNAYDFITAFTFIYSPCNDEYQNLFSRSPNQELKCILQFQDNIISSIANRPLGNWSDTIQPGHIEVPPEQFWKQCLAFINQNEFFVESESILKYYSCDKQHIGNNKLNIKSFISNAYVGKGVHFGFFRNGSDFIPILPRRILSVFFLEWEKLYKLHTEQRAPEDGKIKTQIAAQFSRYLERRFPSNRIIEVVSPIHPDGSPCDFVFPVCLISKDRIIPFVFVSPIISQNQINEELNSLKAALSSVLAAFRSSLKAVRLIEMEGIQFQDGMQVDSFIVLPQVSLEIEDIDIPSNVGAHLVSLTQLLGIMDECDETDEFSSFLEFIEENRERLSPAGLIDYFGLFKASHGVLNTGAHEFDKFIVDVHWGHNLRFASLKEFWEVYPEICLLGEPGNWAVCKNTERKKEELCLDSRGTIGRVLILNFENSMLITSAPFEHFSLEKSKVPIILTEMCNDVFLEHIRDLSTNPVFAEFKVILIHFIPRWLIDKKKDFEQFGELRPNDNKWVCDVRLVEHDTIFMVFVFDEDALFDILQKIEDRTLEVDLIRDAVELLGRFREWEGLAKFNALLQLKKDGLSRHKLFTKEVEVAFPEYSPTYEPENRHFKIAKKRMSDCALECGFEKGFYKSEKAQDKLTQLRTAVIEIINNEVNKYDFADSIGFLLTRIDSLINKYKRKSYTLEFSMEQDVDYNREKSYSDSNSTYVKMHKNYRYLIEKFIQKKPCGSKSLDKSEFQTLIAIIDWLFVIYQARDVLFYKIATLGLKVEEDLSFDVEYRERFKENQDEYNEEMAKLSLGMIGNPNDRVDSQYSIDEIFDLLDEAFMKDYSFKYKHMLAVTQMLSTWPRLMDSDVVDTFYFAERDVVIETIHSVMNDMRISEVENIIKFLTIDPDNIMTILGDDRVPDDLPIWEYRKRTQRYTIRPIIKISNKLQWGPWSVHESGMSWSEIISRGALPTDLESSAIESALQKEKKSIEKNIEIKAHEIVSRHTEYAVRNLELYKMNNRHPKELGDYDTIGFLREQNVILNIECKDVIPVFAFKDARRLRNKIFGKPGQEDRDGQICRIERRQKYLNDNVQDISADLRWPIDTDFPPKIIAIYLTRILHWWNKFPPYETNIVFLRIDMLDEFIRNNL